MNLETRPTAEEIKAMLGLEPHPDLRLRRRDLPQLPQDTGRSAAGGLR
jgi:hypothetical protein